MNVNGVAVQFDTSLEWDEVKKQDNKCTRGSQIYIIQRKRQLDVSSLGRDSVGWIAAHTECSSNFGQGKPHHSAQEIQQEGKDTKCYTKHRSPRKHE